MIIIINNEFVNRLENGMIILIPNNVIYKFSKYYNR